MRWLNKKENKMFAFEILLFKFNDNIIVMSRPFITVWVFLIVVQKRGGHLNSYVKNKHTTRWLKH